MQTEMTLLRRRARRFVSPSPRSASQWITDFRQVEPRKVWGEESTTEAVIREALNFEKENAMLKRTGFFSVALALAMLLGSSGLRPVSAKDTANDERERAVKAADVLSEI